MTSRLKHKLELDNVNLNSAYLNESFVTIGTPLPALAETRKDQLEYVPEWKQEVRDEKGRRRFHGAFEGGWAAGYGNTVGSKEGWAPQTFKSSRTNRANKVQRAEDFMDEEDLAQMNEDRKLENTETFRNEGFTATREELGDKELPSTLGSLIAPTRSSIGQSLLQKLGWRPGQGIGPRVTLRKLKRQAGKQGKQDEDEDMDDPEAGRHTFAPRDAKLLVYQAKEDREGLGYEKGRGMGRLPGQRGPAAGVGHMDEVDDPYGASGSGATEYVFDNAAQNDDDIIVMGGPSRAAPVARIPAGGRGLEGDERWHDGRPVLSGFALDPLGVPPDMWFEMPEIPADWRPRPARVWRTTRRIEEEPVVKVEEKETIRGAPGKPLTFEQRGEALGEEKRVSKAKSVFEYMSEKDRERLASLAAAAQKAAPPPPLSVEPIPVDVFRPSADEVIIPPLSPRTASAALKGFIPYGDDLARQDRYRSYLSSQTYNTTTPYPDLKPAASFDETNKELDDFASSARIFKPMSFAMSSRFTSGSTALAATDLKQAKPGLHLYDAEKAKAEAAEPRTAEVTIQKDLTPREQAAANGMHGKLTREVKEFYPVKLLCKRFGVADPHPEGEPAKINTGADPSRVEALPLPKNDASWESQFVHQAGTDQTKPAINEVEERRPRTLAEVGMAEDVNQGRDTLTYTKPSIDIFKAIFASDDEDEEDDEVEVKPRALAAANIASEDMSRSDPFPVPAVPKAVEVVDEGPVDFATFKPVFAVRRDREDKAKEEKRKERKEKKKRKGVLSFEVGEDGEVGTEEEARREEKRKKFVPEGMDRHSNGNGEPNGHRVNVDVEGEWVEKPVEKPRLTGRMGAADFM